MTYRLLNLPIQLVIVALCLPLLTCLSWDDEEETPKDFVARQHRDRALIDTRWTSFDIDTTIGDFDKWFFDEWMTCHDTRLKVKLFSLLSPNYYCMYWYSSDSRLYINIEYEYYIQQAPTVRYWWYDTLDYHFVNDTTLIIDSVLYRPGQP